jgi:hypothetical protein
LILEDDRKEQQQADSSERDKEKIKKKTSEIEDHEGLPEHVDIKA